MLEEPRHLLQTCLLDQLTLPRRLQVTVGHSEKRELAGFSIRKRSNNISAEAAQYKPLPSPFIPMELYWQIQR